MIKKLFVVSALALLALTLAACSGQAATAPQSTQPPATVAQEQPTALPPAPTQPAATAPQDMQPPATVAQEQPTAPPPTPTQPVAPAPEPAPPATPSPIPTQPAAPAREPAQSAASHTFDTQTSDAGRVVVDVTPLTLSGDAWDFEVAFNTHSVNLDFEVTEVSVLRCDQDQEFRPTAWDGPGPGGHHRSGILKFAALDHPTSFVEIVIRDVARVPERVLRWDVPRRAESSSGSSAVQAAPPQPSPTADDGPARLVLSAQEFYFGDVVMSLGVVSRTMDITNTGPGTLRIEGVEPT